MCVLLGARDDGYSAAANALSPVTSHRCVQSISKALIKGDCYTSLDAKAFADAEAVIDTWEYVDCASDAYKYY